VGGDTVFCSTQAAYEGTSPKMKQVIEGLEAVRDFVDVENMKRRDPALVAQPARGQPAHRPAAGAQARGDGKKCLYLSEQMTRRDGRQCAEESSPR
jgi:hypothetical protein